ncbi:hypothetical protein DP122_00360 [Clostridium tetani]|uniref:ribbon-helix-helix domain-containing protein n=1 Tax=Clostridium tetani TaxID=1513 RepID=UPI00100A4531|nr:hypothetical protein [Clostridium tetani]RXI57268.1 hypothetical protein DP122_00360 [Clostridium tetani]
MIKKENTRIYVTISKKLHSKLKNEAEYEGRSVSNMAATIIKKYYKEKEKDNDKK